MSASPDPSGPLADSWAKIKRADAHASALHAEASAYVELHPARIAHGPDAGSGDYIFWMDLREEPPLRQWGTIVGDILHNLRSALDCLAWQLATAKLGREPTEKAAASIYFPLTGAPAAFASHAVRKFITPTHWTMLRDVQPYQRGYEALGILGRLSNRDKHRVVQPTFLMDDEFTIRVHPVRDCEILRVLPTKPGAYRHQRELARVQGRTTGPQPEMEGKANLSGHICLSDGTRLQNLVDEIGALTTKVVRAFEPTLSPHVL